MIVFTPIRNLPVEILEQKGVRQVVTYNLSSYFSNIVTLDRLIPSIERMPEESIDGDISVIPTFDIAYGNYIMSDDYAFMQFMQILVPVYTDPDTLVQILIGASDFRNSITESLAKLIQQRYGYNTHMINEVEDLIYAEEPSFSIPGLFALDQDLDRWRRMIGPSGVDNYE